MIDSIILVVGYSITQGTLYYFIFEMKYTALKMQSETNEVYVLRKQRIKRIKFLVMFGLIFIFTPCMLASLLMSVTSNLMNEDPNKYLSIVLTLNIVGRIPIISSEIYMMITFITVFRYFVNKKREIMAQLYLTFTNLNMFVIGCVVSITLLKIIETPTLIINGMWYQLTLPQDRTQLQKEIYQFFTMAFISLNDFLIALSLLYFFDFQGTKQRVLGTNSTSIKDIAALIPKKHKIKRKKERISQGTGDNIEIEAIVETHQSVNRKGERGGDETDEEDDNQSEKKSNAG